LKGLFDAAAQSHRLKGHWTMIAIKLPSPIGIPPWANLSKFRVLSARLDDQNGEIS
jgi:hypothetical protein